MLLPLVFVVVAATSSGLSLHRTLEKEWKDHVERVRYEWLALDAAAANIGEATNISGVLHKRRRAIGLAMEANGNLISDVMELQEMLSLSSFLDESADELLFLTSSSPYWGRCSSDKGYNTIDEAFAHLVRDYGSHAQVHANWVLTTFEALREGHRIHSVIIPAVGTGGLLRVAQAAGLRVVATECSETFAAFARFAFHSSRSYQIHPWIGNFGNSVFGDSRDHSRSDVLNFPGSLSLKSEVELVLCDILQESSEEVQFDALITFYAIDAFVPRPPATFLHVLDRLGALVAPGGLWINAGPLQYHDASVAPKLSVTEIVQYMEELHHFTLIKGIDVLPRETYSRDENTALSVNSHSAAAFVLQKAKKSS